MRRARVTHARRHPGRLATACLALGLGLGFGVDGWTRLRHQPTDDELTEAALLHSTCNEPACAADAPPAIRPTHQR